MTQSIASLPAGSKMNDEEPESGLVDGDMKFLADVNRQLSECSTDMQKEIMKHVDYLARKAGLTSRSLLDGKPFKVERQVMLDAIKNIASLLSPQLEQRDKRKELGVEELVRLAEQSLEGWCTSDKAAAIVELIRAEKPQICVEIGIYGGRSLIPAAAALRENGSGAIYGIETWRGDIATEHFTSEINDQWWQGIDFHLIKTNFLRFVAEHGLASCVRIIEAPACDAAMLFANIDYLHIDGAHSIYNAVEDVVLYAKKVKGGGLIIMDDTNWPTTAPAVAVLDSLGERIHEFKKDDEDIPNCIIYRKKKRQRAD